MRIYISLILLSYLGASLIRPNNGDLLYYTHVPFEWTQYPDAIGYNFMLSNDENFNDILLNVYTEGLIYIDKINCDWDSSYYWKIQPVYDGSLGEWSNFNFFSIGESKFDLSTSFSSDELSSYEYTIFSDWYGDRSAVINLEGNEIWNSGDSEFMMNHVNEFGQLFGCSQIDFPNNTGVEINYNQEVVWSADIYYENAPWYNKIDKHEFKQIPNGNYMGFMREYEFGPIPIGDWTENFQNMGLQADGVTNEFPFGGQKLIEYDRVSGQEVWSWNPHNHFSKLDTDLYGGTWWYSLTNGSHDWLHSNAFYFDPLESVIYMSIRHLSRITKIAYPSGEVIWNMGMPPGFGAGDNNICTDLEFSFQHHITKLSNGDLLFFDNGNLDASVFNQSSPTSRVIRVRVVDNSYCELIWSYELPTAQFSPAMGSVQALENGNYFINSIGDGGTVLEINSLGEVLWEINLGMSYPNGNGYRAFRIPSIHPNIFSVIFNNYKTLDVDGLLHQGIILNEGNPSIDIEVYNHSGYTQDYSYVLQDDKFWVETIEDTVRIPAYDNVTLTFDINEFSETDFIESSSILNSYMMNDVNFNIKPIYHQYSGKSFNKTLLLDSSILSIPESYHLNAAFPNPFNSTVNINFTVPDYDEISIDIYNLNGRLLTNLIDHYYYPGYHSINWNAKSYPSGVYFIKMQASDFLETQKVMLLK